MSESALPPVDVSRAVEQIGRPAWLELKRASILITGGTGFFGQWLVATLLNANRRFDLGIQLHVLTRQPGRALEVLPSAPEITLVPGTLLTGGFPISATHVVHAAAPVSEAAAPLAVFDTIVAGTRRLLEWCEKVRPQRTLFVSSGAVYGPQPGGLEQMTEEYRGGPAPADSACAYAEAKRAAEFLCAEHACRTGLTVSIARCFAFIGPGMPLDGPFAAGNFIRDALRRRRIVIEGDGTAVRTYMYAADLSVWLWTILLRGASVRPYNTGGEHPVTILELGQAVAAAAGGDVPVDVCGTRGAGSGRYVPDTARARRELGLQQTVDLEDALRRTVAWCNSQRKSTY